MGDSTSVKPSHSHNIWERGAGGRRILRATFWNVIGSPGSLSHAARMKCVCESFSTAANTWSAATGLITAYTVLGSPQGAHRELSATPSLLCHRGKSPRVNTAVPAMNREAPPSSSSYLPLSQAGTKDWVTPHTEKQQQLWGEAWLWAPVTSSALKLQALLSLLVVTLTMGSPLSCSFLSVQVHHHLPSLSSLVVFFLLSSDLFHQFSPLSHISFSSFHYYFSLLPHLYHPVPNFTPGHIFSLELLCRRKRRGL